MDENQRLLSEITAGARAMGITPLALCARAVGNGKLVARLEAGRSVTLSTAAKIREFIAVNSMMEKAS